MAWGQVGGTKTLFYFHLKSGLIFLLITILAIGGVIYHFSEKVLIDTVESNLQTHADFRKGRILAFVESQKRWMKEITSSQEVIERIDQLMREYRMEGEDSELFQRVRQDLRADYEIVARAAGLDELFLLTPRGELVFSFNSGQEDVGADFTHEGMYGETIFSEVVERVMEQPVLAISRFGYIELMERQTVLMAVPLFSSSVHGERRMIGILVRPLMLGWLRAMLSEYSGLGQTGDVVIAQKDYSSTTVQVNFINILRSSVERTEACAALQRREPEHFPMLRLASDQVGFDGELSGAGWVMDPTCQPVFSVWSWIPELNWGMVVKQDRAEVLEPIELLQQQIVVALIFSILFLLWLARRQARIMSQPIEELTDAAQRDRIDEYPAGDVLEINLLAAAMRDLVSSLHRNEVELEEKVAVRTRELSLEKEFVELILNSMQEGMVVLDSEGGLLRANQTMVQLVGGGQEFSLDEVFQLEREHGSMMRGVILSSSGERIPVQVSQLQLSGWQVNGVSDGVRLMLFYDLRERVRMEEQAQYLAFQSGVAEMSATLLHNVGNAITGISGYVNALEVRSGQLVHVEQTLQALSRQSADGEISLDKCAQGFDLISRALDSDGLNEATEKMKEGVERISSILRAHRSFDQRKVVASTFQCCAMVEDALELIRDDCETAGVLLELHCDNTLYLTLPRNPMIQMVVNLVRNGLESILRRQQFEQEPAGKVVVEISAAEENMILLLVKDNGIGVGVHQQREIFTQRHSLNIADGVDHLHSVANFINSIKGQITVESDGHMQGAVFRIVFPDSLS